MRMLFFQFRRVVGRRLTAGFARLPDVGADWETINVLLVLQRLELDAELEFVRRGQMRKPERQSRPSRDTETTSPSTTIGPSCLK